MRTILKNYNIGGKYLPRVTVDCEPTIVRDHYSPTFMKMYVLYEITKKFPIIDSFHISLTCIFTTYFSRHTSKKAYFHIVS